jgi:phytoene dehydrogenase-like protein
MEAYAQATMTTLSQAGIRVDRESVDFERIQSPLYFETEHGNYKGTLYGADESHRLFGLFPWSNRDSELKNVRYCGGAVQPGAGLPMVTLSGKFAAESL